MSSILFLPEKTVSKSVRLPLSLVEFIEKQPGENFSQKLLMILIDYRDGDMKRKYELDQYYSKLRRCRETYDRLAIDYAKAHRIIGSMMYYLNELSDLAQQVLPDIRADTVSGSAAQDPDPAPASGAPPLT